MGLFCCDKAIGKFSTSEYDFFVKNKFSSISFLIFTEKPKPLYMLLEGRFKHLK